VTRSLEAGDVGLEEFEHVEKRWRWWYGFLDAETQSMGLVITMIRVLMYMCVSRTNLCVNIPEVLTKLNMLTLAKDYHTHGW
jgi:hypothetical protein